MADIGGPLTGTENDDFLIGDARDLGDRGCDNYGNSGLFALKGFGGNDIIVGDIYLEIGSDAEGDEIFGGDGNDRFVAEADDGNDSYFGGLPGVGAGVDTLDMSAIMANISANLGGGQMDRGAVYSDDTGHDTLWNVANIITGAGDDIITASNAVNVIDGGNGNDIFRFETALLRNSRLRRDAPLPH